MPSVSCLVSSSAQADQVVRALHRDGIDEQRISMLFPDPRQPLQLGFENSGPMAPGPIVGPGTGAAMGSVLGWVVGLAAFAIPGVGAFLAVGPILTALSGAAVGATAGALTGALIGIGVPEAQADYYEERIREGRFMIWVDVASREEITRVSAIFTQHGAEDIALSVDAAELMKDEPEPGGQEGLETQEVS